MANLRCTLIGLFTLTLLLAKAFPAPDPGWSAMSVPGDELQSSESGIGDAASAREDEFRIAAGKVPRVAPATRDKVNAQGMSRGMKPPEELRLNLEGRDIVIIYSTGGVRLAEGLSIDEASRDFWRKVGQLAPSFCQAQSHPAKKK